jgi:carboxypeptidase C (cathepsin A)
LQNNAEHCKTAQQNCKKGRTAKQLKNCEKAHSTAQQCTALRNSARHCTTVHGTAQQCTALRNSSRHCTMGQLSLRGGIKMALVQVSKLSDQFFPLLFLFFFFSFLFCWLFRERSPSHFFNQPLDFPFLLEK